MLIKILKSILLGLFVGILMVWLFPQIRYQPTEPSQVLNVTNEEMREPISFSHAVNIAAPTVVYVYNRSIDEDADDDKKLGIRTLGSGVIMSKDGYILTNMHVVKGAKQIVVSLQDGSTYEATLVGADDLTDLAVLKINADNLQVIPVNLERKPKVGDLALAIGNPYNLGVSISQGIISATGRVGLSLSGRQNFLQTDAAINHGNSGGALINSLGELVGINTLSFDKNEDGTPITGGLNFAIPTELAIKVMNKIIKDGRVIRGYFGIKGGDVKMTPNDGTGEVTGIFVSALDDKGPAAKAGIEVGDVLISVNDLPTLSTLGTLDRVAEIAPGTEIPIILIRDEYPMELKLIVGEYPEELTIN